MAITSWPRTTSLQLQSGSARSSKCRVSGRADILSQPDYRHASMGSYNVGTYATWGRISLAKLLRMLLASSHSRTSCR